MLPTTMPFGKHKGAALCDVPLSYLQWLLGTCQVSTGLAAALGEEVLRRGHTPAKTPPPKPPACSCCRTGAPIRYTWMQDRAGGKRIRRECSGCGQWMGFAPSVPPFTDEADKTASTTPTLD